MIPLPVALTSRASESPDKLNLKALNFLNKNVSLSGKSLIIFDSKSAMFEIKPSVVTETTFPPKVWMLCKHSPITLLMNAVVQEAKMGFEREVPVTLNVFPVKLSKLILLDIPRTTFP